MMIESNLLSLIKRPENVEYSQDALDDTQGIFKASPYEKGFGTTLGNSFRRTLLAALPGYAVVAVKFNCVNNEFENIPGVYQDTSRIIINLKKLMIGFKDTTIHSKVFHFKIEGARAFKAKDFLTDDANVIVADPDYEILSTTKKEASFEISIQVELGRGYVPSENLQNSIEAVGTIPIDADYSPINKVSFKVNQISNGGRIDYEELELFIETKGIISPTKALEQAAQILKESYLTFSNVEAEAMTKPIENKNDKGDAKKDKMLYETVYALGLTVKSYFFLKVNEIREIGQLVTKKEDELRMKKHFHEDLLEDINTRLQEHNYRLNMKNVNYVEKAMI